MSDFGSRLKEERARLGMTQEQFARVGGVQKRAQSSYEAGARWPDAAYLAAVERAGADVMYVLTGVRVAGRIGAGACDEGADSASPGSPKASPTAVEEPTPSPLTPRFAAGVPLDVLDRTLKASEAQTRLNNLTLRELAPLLDFCGEQDQDLLLLIARRLARTPP